MNLKTNLSIFSENFNDMVKDLYGLSLQEMKAKIDEMEEHKNKELKQLKARVKELKRVKATIQNYQKN